MITTREKSTWSNGIVPDHLPQVHIYIYIYVCMCVCVCVCVYIITVNIVRYNDKKKHAQYH